MSDFKVIRGEELELRSPVAIIGFPTVGLVGSILASYVTKTKKMKYLAGITSGDLPPYTLIQKGEPFPQIRIYGLRTRKRPDIVIVTSEVALKPEACYGLTHTILEELKELGVTKIVALEGVADYPDSSYVVCGTDPETLKFAKKNGMKVLEEGLVRGMTGIMLFEGKEMGMDVLAMLCPANANMPDPRASAAVIEPLSKLVPSLKIESEPLLKEAEEMENKIRTEVQNNVVHNDNQQIYG